MSMHAMPECEQSQKNGCRGVTRPWQFALLMLCVLLLVPVFVQPALAGPPGCPSYQLFGVTGADGDASLYALDPSNGSATFIEYISDGVNGFSAISAIAFHPTTNVLYAIGAINALAEPNVLMTIDPCSAAGTKIAVLTGDIHPASRITDMSFRPTDQTLFVYNKDNIYGNIVETVNVATGAVTKLPLSDNSGASGNGLAFSPLALGPTVLYHGAGVSGIGPFGFHTYDQSTGERTDLGDFCTVISPNAMDFQPATNKLYASNHSANNLVTINTTPVGLCFAVTSVGPTVATLDAIAFYPNLDSDLDGVLDSVDNCPSAYNPPVASWVDKLNVTHFNSQPDFDLDGVGDACDNCKKVANADQADSDNDLTGNVCENYNEALSPVAITAAPGAPKWFTAQFLNNTGAAINTIQPDCINTLFTVNPNGSPTAILPPTYRHRAYGVPDDVVTIPAGASFSVTCDVNEMFDPSVLSAGTYDVKATYSNDIDPDTNLFVGAVESQPGPTGPTKLTVVGPPVTKTTATVLYDPSVWSTEWVTTGSPSPIKADINLVPGSACNGIDITKGIMMNGLAIGLYTGGVTGAPAHAIASFSIGSDVVRSLGTTSPGVYSPAVQGTCLNGALFTAKAPITLGLTVLIDIKPGSGTNPINMGSRGVVPVAILSTATFDATKVLPGSVTLAGGTVKLKGKGLSTYQYSISDVNGDLRPDMVVQIETTTMTLDPSMTSAVLEGLYVQDLGNGNTKTVPIYGVDNVTIVP